MQSWATWQPIQTHAVARGYLSTPNSTCGLCKQLPRSAESLSQTDRNGRVVSGGGLQLVLDEFGQKLLEELDYNQERRNLTDFYNNYRDDPYVKIPQVYPKYCSSKVLVMEWITGVRCTDPQGIRDAGIDVDEFIRVGVISGLRQLLEVRHANLASTPHWIHAMSNHGDPVSNWPLGCCAVVPLNRHQRRLRLPRGRVKVKRMNLAIPQTISLWFWIMMQTMVRSQSSLAL